VWVILTRGPGGASTSAYNANPTAPQSTPPGGSTQPHDDDLTIQISFVGSTNVAKTRLQMITLYRILHHFKSATTICIYVMSVMLAIA
jgi:hypothetical protein